MANTRGLLELCMLVILLSTFTTTHANWYGKRGDKVDSDLFSLLQGSLPEMIDTQIDARVTLQAIAKLIEDYEIRTMQERHTKLPAK